MEWLRQYGGDHLVKTEVQVDSSQEEVLMKAGIPYREIKDLNTNSLKAFLSELVGLKGGVARVAVEDLPKSFHFFTQQELKVSA